MRFLFRVAVFVLLPLALIGTCYQSFENHIVPKRYPLSGRMVDVGGYKLRIDCVGTASPTVVIDGGIGTATTGWTVVQREVAKFARVCVYDRAGYFASDDGPGPRTSERMAKELHTLLANAGEHGPFVFVGHSFGAFTVRVYHQLYPAEVAGVVMVDGSQEDGTATLKRLLPAHRVHMLEAEQRLLLGVEPLAARVGLLRFFTQPSGTPSDWKLFPPEMKNAAAQWMWRTPFDDIEKKEFARFDESAEQARRSGTLGDLPLIVVTARQPWLGPPVTQEDIPAVMAFQDVWVNDLQMRLVHLSTRGRQVIAEKSNHGIQFLEPEVVVGAVRDVVGQVTAPAVVPPPAHLPRRAKQTPAEQRELERQQGSPEARVANVMSGQMGRFIEAAYYGPQNSGAPWEPGRGPQTSGGPDPHAPMVYQVGGGVSAPVAIYEPKAEYSEEARHAKYQGDVEVQLIVGADGLVKHARVVRDPGLGLAEQALKVARTYRFKPAMKGGEPVAVVIVIVMTFELP